MKRKKQRVESVAKRCVLKYPDVAPPRTRIPSSNRPRALANAWTPSPFGSNLNFPSQMHQTPLTCAKNSSMLCETPRNGASK